MCGPEGCIIRRFWLRACRGSSGETYAMKTSSPGVSGRSARRRTLPPAVETRALGSQEWLAIEPRHMSTEAGADSWPT